MWLRWSKSVPLRLSKNVLYVRLAVLVEGRKRVELEPGAALVYVELGSAAWLNWCRGQGKRPSRGVSEREEEPSASGA